MANYNFTPEQLKAAKTAKSPDELAAKAKEQGIDITLEQAAAFLNGQTSELADEELENVSGGSCIQSEKKEWKEAAAADGHPVFCEGLFYRANCPRCHSVDSLYARGKKVVKNDYDIYVDVKCYSCGKEIGNVDTMGHRR